MKYFVITVLLFGAFIFLFTSCKTSQMGRRVIVAAPAEQDKKMNNEEANASYEVPLAGKDKLSIASINKQP